MAQPLRIADRIDTEARKLRFGRVVLVVLSTPFYILGRVVSTVLKAVGLVIAWILAAIRVGWQDARR